MARRRSARTERRARERAAGKLARQRQLLARLEAGGSPERPLELASAAQVEPRAENEPCLVCDGAVRTVEHRAETVDGRRLRVALVRCPKCGAERTLYFRLLRTDPS